MSEPRSKVDIDDLKDEFLECPVCVEHFNLSDRRPRLLQSCLHAFCTQCLQELLNKEGQGQITCPLCRKVEKVPGKAESLLADPVRSNLVEYLQVTQQKGIQCTDCPDGFEATFRCQPCRMYLCNECRAAHRRTRSTRDHRVISLEEMLDDTTDNLERLHFCEVHPKQQLEFYCTTDDKLCCVSCTVIDHSGHKFQKIKATALAKKQELDNNLKRLRRIGKTIDKRRGNHQTHLSTVMMEMDKSKSDVNAMFDDLKNYAEKRRVELLKLLQEKHEKAVMLLLKQIDADKDTLVRVDSTVLYCKQTKTRTDDVELCLMHKSICRNIGSISDEAESSEQKDILGLKFIPENSPTLRKIISSLGECKARGSLVGLAREVKIVLIGENGPHKILVGNSLIGKQSFSMDRYKKAVSGQILDERSEIDGHTVVVVDAWDYASGNDMGVYNGSQVGGPYGNQMGEPRYRRSQMGGYHRLRTFFESKKLQKTEHEVHLLVIPTIARDDYTFFSSAIRNIPLRQKKIVVFVTDFLTTSLVRSCNIEDYIGYSEQLQSLLKQVGHCYVVLDSGASANSQREFLYDVLDHVKTSRSRSAREKKSYVN